MSAPVDVDALPAGRELDALVAERVFGAPYYWSDAGSEGGTPLTGNIVPGFAEWQTVASGREIPPFSTDIAAAWDVLEAMRAGGWGGELEYSPDGAGFRIMFWRSGKTRDACLQETAPLAICRAALKAVSEA
jgi:hypothetical protein